MPLTDRSNALHNQSDAHQGTSATAGPTARTVNANNFQISLALAYILSYNYGQAQAEQHEITGMRVLWGTGYGSVPRASYVCTAIHILREHQVIMSSLHATS
jgi:hypothetical protein